MAVNCATQVVSLGQSWSTATPLDGKSRTSLSLRTSFVQSACCNTASFDSHGLQLLLAKPHCPPRSFSRRKTCQIACKVEGKERTPPTADAGPFTKLAWYGSEAFGQVVGVFRGNGEKEEEEEDEYGAVISRELAMEALKKDYERFYFVTGNMSMGIYELDCEFADPFVSFRGKKRFKQNVSNLGSFMEEVNLKVLDWKEEEDKVTTKWRFSCVLGLPWRPILAASGGTDHYFSKETGKIYKHVERWDISPADGIRQLFKPNPKSKQKK